MDVNSQIRAVASGSRQDFSCLYQSLRRQMLVYALGVLAGDLPAAEDAVDEAFLDVWQKASQFSGTGNGIGWIRRIVRSKSVDWLRKNGDVKIDVSRYWADDLNGTDCCGQKLTETICDRDWLQKMLGELNTVQRETMVLFYYEEMPISRIAQLMNCPENTVKTRLHHARQKMKARHLELEV